MGFEPTILHDLVGCITTELLETVVSKGQIVGIAWLHSHLLARINSLTALPCHIKASHMNSLTVSRCRIKAY